jgi:hypothetical protein
VTEEELVEGLIAALEATRETEALLCELLQQLEFVVDSGKSQPLLRLVEHG